MVRTVERGEIMRWPPRIGLRGVSVSYRAELVAEPWRFDLLARAAPARAGKSAKAAHRRSAARSPTNIVVSRRKSVFRVSRLDHRSRERRSDTAARASQDAIPGHVRPAGRVAADDDRRGLRVASRARRRVPAHSSTFSSADSSSCSFRAWADAQPITQNDRPERGPLPRPTSAR